VAACGDGFNVNACERKRKATISDSRQILKKTILAITSINATAEEIYQIVWEKAFSVFGIPESIISDLDKIFRSQRWRE
jgi:hypothetical protein